MATLKEVKRKTLVFTVDKFIEKPSFELAQDYVSSGNYYWNSGIFLFKASKYLEELKKFRPDIYEACESSMVDLQVDLDFLRVDKVKFESCPSESVDYAVMKKLKMLWLFHWMQVGMI